MLNFIDGKTLLTHDEKVEKMEQFLTTNSEITEDEPEKRKTKCDTCKEK